MAWRLAKSLETLRGQINTAHPNRSKASDGTIGDAAHSSTVSDHNPNGAGVVTAFDLTHDPANGVDIVQIAEAIRQDPRVKFLIRNRQILITKNGQHWATYNGSNPHTKHLHISVGNDYDNTANWNLAGGNPAPTQPTGLRVMRQGANGPDVKKMQEKLKALGLYKDVNDGNFGPITAESVRNFQRGRGLEVDASIGPITFAAINKEPVRPLRPHIKRGSTGNDVDYLHRRLNAHGLYNAAYDKHFGPLTEKGVKEFQRRKGLVADGQVYHITWFALG